MKQHYLVKCFLILCLLLPGAANAQSFEIGVNGGFSFHTLPIGNTYTHDDKPVISYALNVKADLRLPKTQIGVGFEMVNLTEYNYLIPTYYSRQYVYLSKPLMVPHAFINKIKELDAGYLYAGVMAGPAIAKVGVNKWVYNNPFGAVSGYSTTYNAATGFVAGVQGGGVFELNNKLSLNIELALRYVDYAYRDPQSTLSDNPYKYKLVYFPITAGIRYQL